MRAHPFKILSGLLMTVFLSTTALSEVVPATPPQNFTVADHELKQGIRPHIGEMSFTDNGDPIRDPAIGDP